MATRTMYDATGSNASVLVPKNPEMVAIYLTGSGGIAWTSAEVQLFKPTVQFVRIDQGGAGSPQHEANVMDVEPGAFRPPDVPGWTAKCTAPRPTVYCDRSDLPAVMAVWKGDIWLAAPGLSLSECLAIAANNKQVIAVQNVFGGSFDSSVVIDPNWPAKAPVSPPPPITHPRAPAPPGVWEEVAVMLGVGTDGHVYQTIYSVANGTWSTPEKLT